MRRWVNMRVWDIHPGYLSNRNLLGEHAEIHALHSIISDNKKGYSRHPETKRWVRNLNQLILRHNLTVKEMTLREFKHNSPLQCSGKIQVSCRKNGLSYVNLPADQFAILHKKYSLKEQAGRIPLPKYGSEFWAHHKYSVMARGYQYYKDIQKYIRNRHIFPVEQENDLIEKILNYLKLEISASALDNVILHLWGYFKEIASAGEKEYFFNLRNHMIKLNTLFDMAQKYQKDYLLHSTIFADPLPGK